MQFGRCRFKNISWSYLVRCKFSAHFNIYFQVCWIVCKFLIYFFLFFHQTELFLKYFNRVVIFYENHITIFMSILWEKILYIFFFSTKFTRKLTRINTELFQILAWAKIACISYWNYRQIPYISHYWGVFRTSKFTLTLPGACSPLAVALPNTSP